MSAASSSGKNACIAIGFAVFLAHVILLPMDGCSINPTRSFGPAMVSAIRDCPGMAKGGLEDTWEIRQEGIFQEMAILGMFY